MRRQVQVVRSKKPRPKGQADELRLELRDPDVVWAKQIARDGSVKAVRLG